MVETGGGSRESGGPGFGTTRWSLVVAAGDENHPAARQALETLCKAYWTPVYAYLRRHGARADEAGDLTQGFFARLLEKHWLKEARRERGRFRTFLLTSVRNYLADERERERALKRGGGRAPIPLDVGEAERSYSLEPAHDDTPEKIFDRRWARALLDRCFGLLREESKDSSHPERFDRLRPFMTDDSPESYRDVARDLGVGEPAVRVAVHRMRRRFGVILRGEVAETVHDDAEIEGELRYLLGVLRS